MSTYHNLHRERCDPRSRWRKATLTTDSTVAPLNRQQADSSSLFTYYKRLMRFRNRHAVLSDNLSELRETGIRQPGLIAFIRQSGKKSVLVVHNLTGNPMAVTLTAREERCRKIAFQTTTGVQLAANQLTIPAHSCTILE